MARKTTVVVRRASRKLRDDLNRHPVVEIHVLRDGDLIAFIHAAEDRVLCRACGVDNHRPPDDRTTTNGEYIAACSIAEDRFTRQRQRARARNCTWMRTSTSRFGSSRPSSFFTRQTTSPTRRSPLDTIALGRRSTRRSTRGRIRRSTTLERAGPSGSTRAPLRRRKPAPAWFADCP